MHYVAITVFTFIVLICANVIASNIYLADEALEIDINFSKQEQHIAKAYAGIAKYLNSGNSNLLDDPEFLVEPASFAAHPWINEWRETNKEPDVVPQLLRHLKSFDQHFGESGNEGSSAGNRQWLEDYLILLARVQTSQIALSRYLVVRAEQVFFTAAIASLVLTASALITIFLFIFYNQRIRLMGSRDLNRTLEIQRQTLLSSQRAMISITDDEKRANERAEKLANLVEQSSEAIVQLNHHAQVEHYNRAASILFPKIRSLPPDQPFVDLFAESSQQALKAAVNEALAKHRVVAITPPDQALDRTIEFTVTPVTNAGPDATRSVSILARDISARRQEQEQLKLIIDNAPNALFVCDEDSMITMVNNHTEQLFGYEDGELIGLLVDELLEPKNRASHVSKRKEYLSRPTKAQMGEDQEIFALRKDQSIFPAEISLNPVNIGSGIMIIASVFDLTEQRRQREEIAAANHQLELRNNEMEQFIYTVSHDLKSPLFTISGFAHQLKESIDNISEEQQSKIARIQANVDRMGKLLEDLLQLSRVIRIELEQTQINTDDLVKNVLATLEASTLEFNATINVHAPLAEITGNEGMLFQCVQNLINNGIKYSREGIDPVIDIFTETTEQSISLNVRDNGTGIEPRHHDRIFQIFQRLDTREGTGVGLSIVKTIMDRHGGRVAVDSALGEGATFSLIFPRIA